jgi:glycosyltransferase involved in cell wall biosynthesis
VGVRGEASRRRLVEAGLDARRVFVAPNVFEPGPFEPDPSAAPEHDLVFVGDLVPVKRLDWLLEAAAAAGLSLTIVGDGPERARLERRAREPGLAGRTRFLGRLASAEVAAVLQRSRVFAMTSRYEGLPMALVEAFCCGVPAVVPAVGDVTAYAEDGENALVVRDPSSASFAAAFRRVAGDPGLYARLAKGALATRERILRESSLEASAAAWRGALAGLPRRA